MKNMLQQFNEGNQRRTLAAFGGARLLANDDGTVAILGGTQAEHADAREWLSLFMHDAILRPGIRATCVRHRAQC